MIKNRYLWLFCNELDSLFQVPSYSWLRTTELDETYNELKGVAEATIENSEPGTLTGDGWVNLRLQQQEPMGSDSEFSDAYWSDAEVSSESESESNDEAI